LVEKSERKKPLERPGQRYKGYIKTDLGYVGLRTGTDVCGSG
jgi:hypothetical protein